MFQILVKAEIICRLCMSDTDTAFVSFQVNSTLPNVIEDLTTIRITNDDGLPSQICSRCNDSLTSFSEFKATSLYCQNILRENAIKLNADDNRENILNTVYIVDQFVDEPRKIEDNVIENTAPQPSISQEPVIDQINGNSVISSLKINESSLNSISMPQNQAINKVLPAKRKYTRKVKQIIAKKAKNVGHIADKPTESETNEFLSNPTKTSKLIRHYTRKMKSATNEIKEKKIYPTKKSPCEFCGKLMVMKDLKEHLNTHYGIRPYNCTVVGCTATFASRSMIKSHKKYIHENVRPFECDICRRNFKEKKALRVHLSYHAEPKIPCTICGKMQYTSRSLGKHMMTHTGERPYPCTVCPKAFQSNYNLKVHLRIHTKEKPFKCSQCGEAYGYNSLLKVHTEKMHPEIGSANRNTLVYPKILR